MRNEMTTWLCVLGVASAVLLVTLDVAQGQAAAEYGTRAEAAKQWPREAVRGAKAMVATDEELGSKAGVEILKRGGDAGEAAGKGARFVGGWCGGAGGGAVRG